MTLQQEQNLDHKDSNIRISKQKYRFGIQLVKSLLDQLHVHIIRGQLVYCWYTILRIEIHFIILLDGIMKYWIVPMNKQILQLLAINSIQREISADEGKQFADQHKIHYIETSAKTGEHVDTVFQQMAARIYDKIENKIIDANNENFGIKLGTFYRNDEDEDQQQTSLGKKKKRKNEDCC